MLFALIGKYDPTMMKINFDRERKVMEKPPEGIKVVGRYARVGGRGGFIHLVEADSADRLGALLLEFVDLVEYEIVPIFEITGARAVELVNEYCECEDVCMHGPI
ncbi:MAG: DUF3303 family protein [Chloroflexi bacterium]|nr:DUF3303 family protein [Chloroflexota bacterium]